MVVDITIGEPSERRSGRVESSVTTTRSSIRHIDEIRGDSTDRVMTVTPDERNEPCDNGCSVTLGVQKRRFAHRCIFFALISFVMITLTGVPPTAANDEVFSSENPKTTAVPACGTPPNQPLLGPRGVITTPDFPGPFPVPIECEWVIQTDGSDDVMIEVYFTQLFVTDGLTITEYSQYPPSFRFVTVHEVFNKSHILQYGQSMFTRLPYLVIRFKLDRLEGNHIRVYDDLMDVYGFNITYEMRPVGNERNDVCTLLVCSFSGNCLGNANLSEYKCSCFPGFFGDDCGYGPICTPDNADICENGGTCRHVGRSIAICNCPPGFTGGKCEVPEVNATAECGSSNSCILQCGVNDDIVNNNEGPCPCNVYKNHSTSTDTVRYHVTIKLVNISAIVDENVNEFLQQKILKYVSTRYNTKFQI